MYVRWNEEHTPFFNTLNVRPAQYSGIRQCPVSFAQGMRVINQMDTYEQNVIKELAIWEHRMQRSPSLVNKLTSRLQYKINSYIPEKVHTAITTAIKQMVRTVIFGAKVTTSACPPDLTIEERERHVMQRINFYKKTAAAEGAVTGAGGILLGLADFPLWLTLKIKLLFEIASWYGYDVKEYPERIYILHIFKITFSTQHTRSMTYRVMADWENERLNLPPDIHQFDWRTLQQEYRDYIDVAKLLQLIPGIGAVAGALVNHRLTGKLGDMAMNAYRMRWRAEGRLK